jgi:Flp pilus assembly pilin Flp
MFKRLKAFITNIFRRMKLSFVRDERGQGMVEYFAILAFVAVMIGFLFLFSESSLSTALSQSYSRLSSEFDRMNTAASKGQIPN